VVDFPAPAEPTTEIRCTSGDRTSRRLTKTEEKNRDMSDDQVLAEADLGHKVAMPMVGFGTWQLRGSAAYEPVRYALEAGYRHLDTATMYRNEAEVGRAIRDSGVDRADVFITTKLPPGQADRAQATIDASLRDLGTDHVDLWLIHWPPRGGASPRLWEQFIGARDAGLTRAIGVSNYSPAQIDELIRTSGEAPAVNQIPWSIPQYDPGVLAAHRDRGVRVEGYSSLKGTNLRDAAITEIAGRHKVEPAQVVLRWHLQHGIVVIPKSSHRERIITNFALSGFTLDEAEMARLDGLSRR
jgi:diketogulonate reductase-like aldo/keto reductase